MHNTYLKHKLSPNQFYLLCCISEGEGAININIHQELRQLETDEWVKEVKGIHMLQPKAVTLVQQVESFVTIHKKKTDKQVMGEDFELMCEKFRQVFPKMLSPTSQKPLRTNLKSVIEGMRWFMENHEYSWEEILRAAYTYVDAFEKKKYHYMVTCQYFIRKQNTNRIWESQLADYCATIDEPDDEKPMIFSPKVL